MVVDSWAWSLAMLMAVVVVGIGTLAAAMTAVGMWMLAVVRLVTLGAVVVEETLEGEEVGEEEMEVGVGVAMEAGEAGVMEVEEMVVVVAMEAGVAEEEMVVVVVVEEAGVAGVAGVEVETTYFGGQHEMKNVLSLL